MEQALDKSSNNGEKRNSHYLEFSLRVVEIVSPKFLLGCANLCLYILPFQYIVQIDLVRNMVTSS